ncbi:hypothetical protein P5673_024262 [Acropora cervicornis]|uniref:Uncharacterized protein n=1 Tax=Acropora cervicornis TaxID=6130 RepID=A0AAD9Q4L4_ACRCE|nr:hypothetical protein P5673_024262 [Acropora cervicornis]
MFVKLKGCGETTVMKHVFGKMKVCYIVRSPNTRCHPNVLLLEESEVQKRSLPIGVLFTEVSKTPPLAFLKAVTKWVDFE